MLIICSVWCFTMKYMSNTVHAFFAFRNENMTTRAYKCLQLYMCKLRILEKVTRSGMFYERTIFSRDFHLMQLAFVLCVFPLNNQSRKLKNACFFLHLKRCSCVKRKRRRDDSWSRRHLLTQRSGSVLSVNPWETHGGWERNSSHLEVVKESFETARGTPCFYLFFFGEGFKYITYSVSKAELTLDTLLNVQICIESL